MKDIPATQDSAPLNLVPLEHTMPNGDNESYDEYCEETDTCCLLAELLEQFKQIKDQFARLKSTTNQSKPMAQLSQLTDKLQHLTMMLELHSFLQPSKELVHKTIQIYTDTLHAPRYPHI